MAEVEDRNQQDPLRLRDALGTVERLVPQRIAGRVANRNFTRDEWRQFFPDEPNYRPTFPELPVPPDVSLNRPNSPPK